MNAAPLKDAIRAAIWRVADAHIFVRSATLTGSFVDAPTLDGISDIDCVVVVDALNAYRFDVLHAAFDAELRPLLAEAGYDFQINATLGPLKFNGPKLAVLHLMLYSQAARVEHAHNSPFTVLDWQRSGTYRKRSLADVYPVFGLQPRHFLGARRSIRDYLNDLRAGVVSYRELVCTDTDYAERKHGKPMTVRDRHEFAYHVMRFLMGNLRKLVGRTNDVPPNEELLATFFGWFPAGAERFAPLFRTLAAKKKALDFAEPVPDLEAALEQFALAFEEQFREAFHANATTHILFRHAPTRLNGGVGDAVIFQGRTDENVAITPDAEWDALAASLPEVHMAYASPTKRARQSLARLRTLAEVPFETIDDRLHEIDYGRLERKTVRDARRDFPELFAAWSRGDDPRMPGGESTADVRARLQSFADERFAGPASVSCTHNVALRGLVGQTLGVPQTEWHRLRVPHLAPFAFVQSAKFGRFVNVPEAFERELFADWNPARAAA